MIGLTTKQAECLKFIRDYVRENDGRAPSYAEMMVALDESSKSRIHALVIGLEERGAIVRLPGQSRAISVVDPEMALAEQLRSLSDAALRRSLRIVRSEMTRRSQESAA